MRLLRTPISLLTPANSAGVNARVRSANACARYVEIRAAPSALATAAGATARVVIVV